MKKWSVFILIVLTCLFMMSGCSSVANSKKTDAEYVLRLGHLQTETHPYHKGALKFKELVEKK
ncbi:hypothetical protein [Neobacillus sp. 19]|uniref:hypothetical protein n=1 Tax=Neobacillus sp. 19 TaxID=3394458 RepID=UPI003BF71864